ncbi:MAG: ribokinase [Clostridia bacterium]|nr:ribokinase [Clostridia bacterium]
MSKIAVIGIAGESVFLSVPSFGKIGETTVATDIHKELGGKGFNQAVAIARYGMECSFLCAVNKNDVRLFSEIAKEEGIKPYFIAKEQPSPYAVITTDKNGDNCVCVYRGAELEVCDVDDFSEKIKTADLLLLNNETPVAVNEHAVKIAKKYGVKVVLNPAPKRCYSKAFLDNIDLFTPNEHETDGLEAYENVVVTLGNKGCLVKSTGMLIPAEKVKNVVDTTGAGDTFNGVLAACIAEGVDIETACRRANVASAIKVGRKYILKSIPTKNEIEKFRK